MDINLIVHTGAAPDSPLPDERSVLDEAADVALVLRGKCETPAQVLAAVADADAALCASEPFTEEVFAGAPNLRVVVRYGIGVDTIDLDAATRHGVMVANFPDFCIEEVANHALALLLACAKKIVWLDHRMRAQGWGNARALLRDMGPVHGETLGLVGFGNIGRAVARRASVLGMPVIASDPYVPEHLFAEAGAQRVDLTQVARRSDYVSLHVPATTETRGLIDAGFLAAMKASAYLINTSRGAVVNETDLIAALQAGRIAGAALDVFATEPLEADNPLLSMENVVLTPHTASYADATFASMRRRVAVSALAVVRGGLPEFVANPAVLDKLRR
jgi:D-3-phosphoglycerate dehydrogenase